jgi:hypothetical protein
MATMTPKTAKPKLSHVKRPAKLGRLNPSSFPRAAATPTRDNWVKRPAARRLTPEEASEIRCNMPHELNVRAHTKTSRTKKLGAVDKLIIEIATKLYCDIAALVEAFGRRLKSVRVSFPLQKLKGRP